MLANIDKLNAATLMVLPLQSVDPVEAVKALYDAKVPLSNIEATYNALDDFYAGQARQWEELSVDGETY